MTGLAFPRRPGPFRRTLKTAGSSGVSDFFRRKDGGRIPGAAMFSLAAASEVLLERAGGNGLGVLSSIRCKCSGFPLSLYHREEC
ncbi:MAG: hypothetical protein BAA03_09355 [Caldibacillus debilis]|nr:MAG: hypothetical protein BAA03_09355 [Caldibacillus debilis]